MHWLLAGIATIGAVEVIFRAPFASTISQWRSVTERVIHVIRSRSISDHWKEIVVPTYAFRLFRLTARLAVLLVIVVSPFAVAWAVSVPADIALLEFLSSMIGILFSTVVGASYAWLRVSGVRARL